MKRAITAADRAVAAVFGRQGDLVTRSQALSAGLTKDALRHRLSPSGPWRVVLPGVYLAHNGGLTIGPRRGRPRSRAGRLPDRGWAPGNHPGAQPATAR